MGRVDKVRANFKWLNSKPPFHEGGHESTCYGGLAASTVRAGNNNGGNHLSRDIVGEGYFVTAPVSPSGWEKRLIHPWEKTDVSIRFECIIESETKEMAGREQAMDIIIGGGTYGERAFLKIGKSEASVIVIDTDPFCSVQMNHGLRVVTMEQLSDAKNLKRGAYFIQGGIAEAAQIVTTLRPERIFATVPVHVTAGIISACARFEPDPAGADAIAASIPERLVIGRKNAEIFCSLNPDMLCNPDCPEPAVCPVTGEKRDEPLWSLLRTNLSERVPEGTDTHRTINIQSRQCGPGLGYIRGSDIFSAIETVQEKQTIWIGTACKCHGVMTALRKCGQTEDSDRIGTIPSFASQTPLNFDR